MASSSKKVILAALLGSTLIAVTKFIAAALAGSAGMLSEDIHSVVNTGQSGVVALWLEAGKAVTRRTLSLRARQRDLFLGLCGRDLDLHCSRCRHFYLSLKVFTIFWRPSLSAGS